ncbi:MAG: beta-N-acetylhexosaminidase [Bacteroidales bacterium]|nr:beta-N-acetylhexosaminidase [Bacteroidales bacterium]
MNKVIIFFTFLLLLQSGFNLNAQNPDLLPVPQKAEWGKSKFPVAGAKILVSADFYAREERAISQFISFVKNKTGLSLPVIYTEDPNAQLIVLNSGQPGTALPAVNEKAGPQSREAYNIGVTAKKVRITASYDAGIYYALQTLRQLITWEGNNCFIPEVDIEDYPSFAYRGVMMDFSHGGLLTEEEIKNQIDFLARWKMNQYYFYNEVSIEMKGYPLINYNACYSQEQIKRIVAYGRERHMDVIPFVNFYGHLHELLRLEKYAGLGIGQYGHDLDPRDPGVQTLLKDWIKQYAEIFPSPFIHVGFDETWETERLIIADSSIKPKELYLKQINFVTSTLKEYGKKVMFWTDITNNYPDIMSGSDFPRDLIPVIWEYSDSKGSFQKWLKPIQKEKMPFFVQSAVDNWGNVYLASKYTFDNIDLCLKTSRDEKAIGYITSIWTDAVQPLLRNTWLYMAYGSVGAWQNEPIDRDGFINSYCKIMYPGKSAQMSNAFSKLAESEALLAKCLGRHTLLEMWENPFSSFHLNNTKIHLDDYKNARMAAETAEESLFDALNSQTEDTAFIRTLLVSSRMLDFTASRFIWASHIVERWNWIYDFQLKGKKDYIMYYDINYSTHGLTIDMMDYCTQLKEEYRKAWLSENMPYRMGTITGRFDSEYLLWRNINMKIDDYRFHNNSKESRLKFEVLFLNNK